MGVDLLIWITLGDWNPFLSLLNIGQMTGGTSPVPQLSSCKQNYLFIDSFSVLFSGAQLDCNSESLNCKENKDIKSCFQKFALQLEAGNQSHTVYI